MVQIPPFYVFYYFLEFNEFSEWIGKSFVGVGRGIARLGSGATPYGVSFFITPHIWRLFMKASRLIEQKYHAASVQLRKYSESKFKENSKSALEVLGSIHYSAMKNSKACQT